MFKEINDIIELTGDIDKRILSPKLIYNEIFLLSVIMSWFKKQKTFIVNSDLDRKICKAFQLIDDDARCYIDATLETPFKIRKKGEKDPLAEVSSKVSGVVGHFNILYGKKKERIVLKPEAKQFIVLETTLDKPLKKGTKKFKTYNQVARDIGCMIQTLNRLENKFLDYLGLFVIAPDEMLKDETFKTYTYKPNIEKLIISRQEGYFDNNDFIELFQKLFQRIDVDCIAYEDVLRFIKKNDSDYYDRLINFYELCLRYHGLETSH